MSRMNPILQQLSRGTVPQHTQIRTLSVKISMLFVYSTI